MAPEQSSVVVLEIWQVVTLVSGVGGGLVATFTALLNRLIAQFEERQDERFKAISADGQSWRDLERAFLNLRAELPEKYVRREDYIRGQTVIEAKLDALSSEIKIVQIQQGTRAP